MTLGLNVKAEIFFLNCIYVQVHQVMIVFWGHYVRSQEPHKTKMAFLGISSTFYWLQVIFWTNLLNHLKIQIIWKLNEQVISYKIARAMSDHAQCLYLR